MTTRGRPRSAEAHAAILEAAIALLVEGGYRGFSMERVADRAGVGKATIYRRFASKDELLKEAIASLSSDFEYVDTGSLETDWLALVASGTSHPAIQGIPQLLGDLMAQPDLHRLFSEQLVEPRRAVARQLLARAQKRGEIRKDADLEVVIDLLVGSLIYRLLRTGGDAREAATLAPAVLQTLVAGLRPRSRARSR